MCRQDSRVHLSAEEEIAAEESLSIYCKPVELYNILQRRAIRNVTYFSYIYTTLGTIGVYGYLLVSIPFTTNKLFVETTRIPKSMLTHTYGIAHQFCIRTRIQMTVSLSGAVNDGLQTQSLFPLYILLARPISSIAVAEAQHSAVYRFSRACILTSYMEAEGMNQAQAKFILPEMSKLSAEVKSGSLSILFVSCAEIASSSCGSNLIKDHMDMTYFPLTLGGYCLLGKIPMELLYLSWEKSPNLSLGERAEMLSTVDMQSCFVKLSCSDEEKSISFHIPCNSRTLSASQQVPVIISAEEIGAKEKSPYNSYSYSDVPTSSLPHIIRLRTGNVIFNYRYYNDMLQRTEVTEDFSCPFCLVKCASFQGLRHHLPSSHDLFNFEFWVTEDCQAVNVTLNTDVSMSEIVADGVDPKQQTFFFCSKPFKRRKAKSIVQAGKHVYPLVLDTDFPTLINGIQDKSDGVADLQLLFAKPVDTSLVAGCMERDTSSPNITGVSSATAHSYADPECVQSVPSTSLATATVLQFAKTRKLSVERSDSRNRALLQKRQFFHSHRAQPMELEQVLSDRDSEDEVDDDVADFEDRRMLDDFVDVTKDEKQMMHLWNSFVRKQRVLADGHIPWACEAFSRLHGQDLVQAPALLCCWRLFMIKLWNHGLLDARTMNTCNIILEQSQIPDDDPKRS
ncbi:hypothetical protein LguiB_003503 [Lonicera macranthoides]